MPDFQLVHRVSGISSYARRAGLLAVLAGLALGGCPLATVDGLPVDDSANNTFATATAITLGENDQAEFTAGIDSMKDVDIFDLGILSPGDRLYVDVQTTSGNLDPLAAVFDERQYLLAFNDDRMPDASNLNPLIDVTVPGAEGTYFLGVAPYPGGTSSGDYRVIVRVTRDVGLLNPEPQTVYLNWVGGTNVVIENVGVFDVPPFDAADVGLSSGQTDGLKDAIQNVIANRFAGFALTLVNSDDATVPAQPFSTVYFGDNSQNAFAIAEKIDTFNVDQSDNAIVFTDGFRDAFVITPTLQQLATAIGNTAAHEIGHLLGLVHTKDCQSLMDTTCGNQSLLAQQVFKLAPIDSSVFPVGLQNAVELIQWAIGLAGI